MIGQECPLCRQKRTSAQAALGLEGSRQPSGPLVKTCPLPDLIHCPLPAYRHPSLNSHNTGIKGRPSAHMLLAKCDPQNCPLEKTPQRSRPCVQTRVFLLSRGKTALTWWRNSAFLQDSLEEVSREREEPRRGGCAGSPTPTRLSLQICEMQGDSAKLQGKGRCIPAERLSISGR